MRFLFKALLAATALLPVATAADAQDGRRERGGDRSDRGVRVDRGPTDGDQRGGVPDRAGPESSARPDRRDGWDGRHEDRPLQGAGAAAPAPPVTGQADVRGSRDWSRSRLDPGRGDGVRGGPRDQGIARGRDDQRDWNVRRDQRNWTSQRAGQRRDDRRFDNRGRDQNWRDDGRNAGRYDAGRYNDRGNWNRTWRNDDRYDWNGYRANNRGAYRLPRYYAPQGWGNGYRRFSVGVTLSSVLWNQNYWIEDPYSYRLPEAYGPYRWVRYYDDALLVDVRDGRVIDTVYGIFW